MFIKFYFLTQVDSKYTIVNDVILEKQSYTMFSLVSLNLLSNTASMKTPKLIVMIF